MALAVSTTRVWALCFSRPETSSSVPLSPWHPILKHGGCLDTFHINKRRFTPLIKGVLQIERPDWCDVAGLSVDYNGSEVHLESRLTERSGQSHSPYRVKETALQRRKQP